MDNSQIVGIPPLRTAPVGDMLLLVPLQVGLRPLLCAWALVSFGFFPLVSPCTWTYMFSIAFSLILVLHSAILDYPQINVPKLDKAMSLRWFLYQTVNIYFCWIRFLGHSIQNSIGPTWNFQNSITAVSIVFGLKLSTLICWSHFLSHCIFLCS